jgi:SAM-dependent methyltransferase
MRAPFRPALVMSETFDAAYYKRFYVNRRTQAVSRQEIERRATTVAALMQQLEIPVRRILDAGCGLGWMRRPLVRAFPDAEYVGLEISEHLCSRMGWIQGSLTSYRPRGGFDLIICHDVMQYLDEREAKRAFDNLAKWCRGALYFHAPTVRDWRENADPTGSDANIHLRSAKWYRTQLTRYFTHAGFGLYVKDEVPLLQWELEKAQ